MLKKLERDNWEEKIRKRGDAIQRFDTYHGYVVEGRNVEGQMYRGGYTN